MIIIPKVVYQGIIRHVQAEHPLEACGLVAGLNGRLIHDYPVVNRLQSPTAFEMEPQQQIKTMIAIEERGWGLTAVYHSHPNGPAYPSPTDVAQACYPDTIQLIISLQQFTKPEMRGFTIVDGQISAVSLHIE